MNTEELKKALNNALESKNIEAIDQHFCDIARCVWHGVEDLEEAKRLGLVLGCEVIDYSKFKRTVVKIMNYYMCKPYGN